MKEANINFVNDDNSGYVPVPEATYPAHVSSFKMNEYNGSYVFNVTFKVADEAKELKLPKLRKDNNGNHVPTGEHISGAFVTGKEYRTDKGVWLTPNPSEGEEWKNKRYKEFFEKMGVSFPSNDDGVVQLGIVEDEDVYGLPCLIKLKETEFTNKDGESKKSLQVIEVSSWEKGTRISKEEFDADDLPF